MSLFVELKRRNVFKVALMYGVVGWLLAQVLQFAAETFAAPDWVLKMFVVVLLLGFPVALIISWVYELTPEGIKKESEIDRSASAAPQTGQRLNTILIGTLAVAVLVLLADRFISRPDSATPAEVPLVVQEAEPETTKPLAAARSVAVLPFVNMSGDQDNEYFSDGLSETLLHMLAQIKELQVAARTSAFKFKGQNEDVRIIGEQLGVAHVLEGSVQRSGDRIRITAQLISVDNGFHLWSQTYDRTLDDVFQVQDDIAASVAEAMQITLLGKPVNSEASGSADNYDQLLRARAAIARGSSKDFELALEILQQVIVGSPGYAPAYASLAAVYNAQNKSGDALIPEQTAALAVQSAQMAVNLDPALAVAYSELGQAYTDGDFANEDLAFSALNKAYELQPGSADSMVGKALVLAGQGHAEDGLALLLSALRLDPLNNQILVQVAAANANAGRMEQAEKMYLDALAVDPKNTQLLFRLALMARQQGRLVAAEQYYQLLVSVAPNHIGALQGLFYMYVSLGDLETARVFLERGEVVSTRRMTDERAILCVLEGNETCVRAATERMIAERDAPFVASWKARLELKDGQVGAAIETMAKMLVEAEATKAGVWIIDALQQLTRLYSLSGDNESRDRIFARMLEILNGDSVYVMFGYAGAYAAIGDAQQSARYLEQSYELGFRQLDRVKAYWLFDSVREAPEFRAIVQMIEKDNARMLAEIRATL